MKYPLIKSLALCVSVIALTQVVRPPTDSGQHLQSERLDQTKDFSPNWTATATKHIEQREYEIRRQGAQAVYTSPNRQQNLRVSYHPNGFSLAPRIDSSEKWSIDIAVKGVFRDEVCRLDLPDLPQVELNASNMRQHFGNGLHIEYNNGPEGMRQNFLLEKKPQGQGDLKLRLATSGDLYPKLTGVGEVVFEQVDQTMGEVQKRFRYHDLQVFDASGKRTPARMRVHDTSYDTSSCKWLAVIDLEVQDAAATYPLLIDPLSSTAAAMVESNQTNAQMGYSVRSAGDVNGDGYSDMIIGAVFYELNFLTEGAAFIYHGSANGISTVPATTIYGNQFASYMGFSVSTAGDANGDGYSDIIVGADGYNGYQGAALAYYGSPSGINAGSPTVLTINQADARMGQSVACAGDINADGYSDVVIGATYYDNGQINEGAAIVYYGSATGLDNTNFTILEENQDFANMGISCTGAGDVNADGYSDIIVGAIGYSNGQNDEGVAFVYHGTATGINTTYSALLEPNEVDAVMGFSVSSAGDVNGDGYSDVIVGALWLNGATTNEGGAFVFHGGAAGVSTTASSTLLCNQANAEMGSSVALAGDLNGDGYSDVIVGARAYDNGETDEGVAFVYEGSATGISTLPVVTLEVDQAGASFGFAVASAGDLNGDGYSDLVVGANGFDNGENDEGAAFVYHGAPSGISTAVGETFTGGQASAEMGTSVNSAGDVNGDGYSDIVVSARYYDNGETDEGAAFVYHGSATGISPTYATMLESNQVGAIFAYGVSSAGDVNGDGYSDIVVGALMYDNGETDEGAAFVFHGGPTGINPTPATILEANLPGAWFGSYVACLGDVNGDGYSDIGVGIWNFSNPEPNEGGAYIYHGSPTGINPIEQTILESNQADAQAGLESIGAAGDVNGDGFSDVILGAYHYDNGETDEGAAFIYHGSSTGVDATYDALVESNQVGAALGNSVTSAGDVNGDGFADVIVGAHSYDNGETDEGAAFIYLGSASGINTTPATVLDCDQAGAQFGVGTASAGDVNGDGYSDVVVGAWFYTSVSFFEGAIFVFHGSPAGVSANYDAMMTNTFFNAEMGHSVASAGDVNGDGYSDILAGAHHFEVSTGNEGGTFLYYGNNGQGLTTKAQQFEASTTNSVSPGCLTNSDPQIRFQMHGKSFIGRQDGKFVWEYMPDGQPFSSAGPGITNSVSSGGQTSSTTMAGTGVPLFADVSVLGTDVDYKWRCRVRYDPVTALSGQVYGPWFYHKSRTPEVASLGFKLVSSAVSIAEATPQGGLMSYPNPNDGQFYIQSAQVITIPVRLEVWDAQGKLCMAIVWPQLSAPQRLNLSHLQAGLYFLQLNALDPKEDFQPTRTKVVIQ